MAGCSIDADSIAAVINPFADEVRREVVFIKRFLENARVAYGLVDDGSGKVNRKVAAVPSNDEPKMILPGPGCKGTAVADVTP